MILLVLLSFRTGSGKVYSSNRSVINIHHTRREPDTRQRCTWSILIISVCAKAAKSKATMWEQASQRPAMHVQWAETIVPHFSAATQGKRWVADTACECLTTAVNTSFESLWPGNTVCTETLPTQPETRYLYPSRLLYAFNSSLVYSVNEVVIDIWILYRRP